MAFRSDSYTFRGKANMLDSLFTSDDTGKLALKQEQQATRTEFIKQFGSIYSLRHYPGEEFNPWLYTKMILTCLRFVGQSHTLFTTRAVALVQGCRRIGKWFREWRKTQEIIRQKMFDHWIEFDEGKRKQAHSKMYRDCRLLLPSQSKHSIEAYNRLQISEEDRKKAIKLLFEIKRKSFQKQFHAWYASYKAALLEYKGKATKQQRQQRQQQQQRQQSPQASYQASYSFSSAMTTSEAIIEKLRLSRPIFQFTPEFISIPELQAAVQRVHKNSFCMVLDTNHSSAGGGLPSIKTGSSDDLRQNSISSDTSASSCNTVGPPTSPKAARAPSSPTAKAKRGSSFLSAAAATKLFQPTQEPPSTVTVTISMDVPLLLPTASCASSCSEASVVTTVSLATVRLAPLQRYNSASKPGLLTSISLKEPVSAETTTGNVIYPPPPSQLAEANARKLDTASIFEPFERLITPSSITMDLCEELLEITEGSKQSSTTEKILEGTLPSRNSLRGSFKRFPSQKGFKNNLSSLDVTTLTSLPTGQPSSTPTSKKTQPTSHPALHYADANPAVIAPTPMPRTTTLTVATPKSRKVSGQPLLSPIALSPKSSALRALLSRKSYVEGNGNSSTSTSPPKASHLLTSQPTTTAGTHAPGSPKRSPSTYMFSI